MNVLLVGASGQLGHCLRDQWPGSWNLLAPTSRELDIRNASQVERFVAANRLQVIINAAAYNAVDAAERDSATAFAINAAGPATLARASASAGTRLVHISTDYVFAGRSGGAAYSEDDSPAPLNQYGRSKRQGELAVMQENPDALVVRTSWLFSEYGVNFVTTMLRLARERSQLSVVDDQFGCPTYAGDLAGAVISLLRMPTVAGGIYHYCGTNILSWFDFARRILDREIRSGQVDLRPISTAEYGAPAPRPAYSALACGKMRALGIQPRSFESGLRLVKQRLQEAP